MTAKQAIPSNVYRGIVPVNPAAPKVRRRASRGFPASRASFPAYLSPWSLPVAKVGARGIQGLPWRDGELGLPGPLARAEGPYEPRIRPLTGFLRSPVAVGHHAPSRGVHLESGLIAM